MTQNEKTTRSDLFLVMIAAIIISVGIYKGYNVPIEAFITLGYCDFVKEDIAN